MDKRFAGIGFSFDLDGTLYPVSRLRIAWRLRQQLKQIRALARARERIRKEAPFETEAELVTREAELMAETLSGNVDAIRNQLPQMKKDLAAAATAGRRPFAGVLEVLRWAHDEGAKLAVFSDYEPKTKLKALGLDQIPWTICLGADTCGALKPHRKGYDLIRDSFGFDADCIVHIGDRMDSDVAGAVQVGMRPVLYRMSGEIDPSVEGLQVLKSWEKKGFERLITR